MSNKLEEVTVEIKTKIESFLAEIEKEAKGNASAGGRARKLSLELRELLKSYRSVSVESAKA